MKHAVKFAAPRDERDYFAEPVSPAEEPAPNRQIENLVAFPRASHAEEPEFGFDDLPEAAEIAAEPPRIADLAAELEAALMSDLRSVSELLGPAPQPVTNDTMPAETRIVAPQDEEEVIDREVFERLMASVRQPVAQPATEPERPATDERPIEPRWPQRGPHPARSARPVTERAPRAERPLPAASLSPRLPRALLVGAALLALAGGGAFVTVQSVTARTEDAPVSRLDPAMTGSIAGDGGTDAAKDAVPPAPAEAAAEKSEDRAVPSASMVAAAPAVAAIEAAPRKIVEAEAAPAPAATSDADTWSLPETAVRSTLAAPEAAIAAEPDSPTVAPDAATAPPARPALKTASIPPSRPAALRSGAATITSGVKLRSNPDNGAPVLGLLSAGTSVKIVGCKGWCEVVAGDKRGFVFQRFLSQSPGAAEAG